MKILIADDYEIARRYLERVLRERGYSVECAANGVQALEKAAASPPDVIVSDILMPEMDGFMFCRRVKEDKRLKNIPFIFYSATFCGEEDKKLALSLGAAACLVKPLESDDFLKAILKALEESKTQVSAAAEKAPQSADLLDRRYHRVMLQKLQLKIQELEAAHKSLAESERRYRTLTEAARDAIFVVDRNRVCRYINEYGAGMLGLKPEALTGRPFEKFFPGETARLQKNMMEEVLKTVQPKNFISDFSGPGGFGWADVRLVPILSETGKVVSVMGIARDITERKRVEEELREFTRQLVLAREEERKKFSALLHNEIGAMIVGLTTSLFLAEEEFRQDGKCQALSESCPAMRGIKKTKKRIRKLAGKMRDICLNIRLPDMHVCGLSGAVSGLISNARDWAKIKIHSDISLRHEKGINDCGKMVVYRIVQEALHNVLRHSGAKNVKIGMKSAADKLKLLIADDGGGFDTNKKQSRAEKTKLGLKIIREQAESVGGALTIESKPGCGTAIKAEFPLKSLRKSKTYAY